MFIGEAAGFAPTSSNLYPSKLGVSNPHVQTGTTFSGVDVPWLMCCRHHVFRSRCSLAHVLSAPRFQESMFPGSCAVGTTFSGVDVPWLMCCRHHVFRSRCSLAHVLSAPRFQESMFPGSCAVGTTFSGVDVPWLMCCRRRGYFLS